MYKALLAALIGLFFSVDLFAGTLDCVVFNAPVRTTPFSEEVSRFSLPASTGANGHAVCAQFYSGTTPTNFSNTGSSACKWAESLKLTFCTNFVSSGNPPSPDQCSVNPSLPVCGYPKCPDGQPAPHGDLNNCDANTQPPTECPDGTLAPNNNAELCPWYDCPDGSKTQDLESCPVTCPDGSLAPNGSVDFCPVNCDVLSGGGGPDCDTEEPSGYCTPSQSPIFDDCQYGPNDPRNPPPVPDPEAHCEEFPDSVSCKDDLPELPDTPFCKKYPNHASCKTPEPPKLDDEEPPPPSTNPNNPPPPAPIETPPESPNRSTDNRLDNLRYDIGRLHSGLNYQTGIIAKGFTGVSSQLQAIGGKADLTNTLLDGVNKNLDSINGSLKGTPLSSGSFDVEGGINTALGITGNEKISDLTKPTVKLEDYRSSFNPFLQNAGAQCPENLPVNLRINGMNYTFDLYYKPVCDFMSIAGTILNWAVWLSVPFIVFGRRRAS